MSDYHMWSADMAELLADDWQPNKDAVVMQNCCTSIFIGHVALLKPNLV